MASDEYWKDKRISRRQVLSAWAILIALVAGAQFAAMAYSGMVFDAGMGRPSAMAANAN